MRNLIFQITDLNLLFVKAKFKSIFPNVNILCMLTIIIISGGCEDNFDDSEYTEIEFFKFSDFGCDSDSQWSLNRDYRDELNIITSQTEFDKIVDPECSPQIDFTKYVVLAGMRGFSTEAYFYDEKVEENNSTIVYTVTFSVTEATRPSVVFYYVIINKPAGKKKIKFVEGTK